MKKQLSVRAISLLMAALCAILIVPLIAIARYAQPFADDYKYGMAASAAWLATGSLGAALRAAAEQVALYYQTWQGTYSALFLMGLQPGIWGSGTYWIGGAALILLFAGANLYFFRQVLSKLLKATAWEALAVASALLIVMIQYVHDAGEAFYWFNGAVYYTGFHALMLIFFGVIASMASKGRASLPGMALCALLGALLGGGNLSTALFAAVALLIAAAAAFYKKSPLRFALAALLLILLAGLLVSALAPGNTRREDAVERYIGSGLSPLEAIALSFAVGGYVLASSLSAPAVVAVLFTAPFLYAAARRSDWKFRRPLAAIALGFCAFCTEATPPLYAMGIHIADRLRNVLHFTAYLYAEFALYYALGFWIRRSETLPGGKGVLRGLMEGASARRTAFFAVACALFFVACAGACRVGQDDDGAMRITGMPAGVEAALDIASGRAARYRRETLGRLELIDRAEAGQDLVVPRHTDEMPLISYEDITPNPADWKNVRMAQYYGLGSIRTE